MAGFYIQYLEGLCARRSWPQPAYTSTRTPSGYTSQVLVNNRAYSTSSGYVSEVLARENAAMRAFMVCREISLNGGVEMGRSKEMERVGRAIW